LPANDSRRYAQQASQLLSVGRVDEAGAEIERALRLDPNASDALSLQTIVFVVQNQKDMALATAERAVNAAPTSASARIALSYAQQARFDLEAARASLEEAVKLDPANALAWARLAEIEASFGRLDKSLEAAKKAVSIDPNLSRTQTVLGFAYLTQVETQQAREAFDKAIAFDQADPLPRLGMGLAIIRDGNLEEGGRQIEIAASLDPNNSIIRSYLGKTYYEEKRTGLDEREYAIAKELDPNDPTPFFYDAIAKQTTNRPVEALRDYQKAIELNDNRAVYRSKLLLDSDEAARQSAIARVYSDLGFQQLALVEGWKSVNTDPTNFSAHRFLADSLSVQPRHQIARVSELLQSQLLQPINITPIQPRLAESNLFLISAQGPSAPGFNTYNPLFNRNQATLLASGLWGENDTWAGESIFSGIYNNLSLSAGYSYFNTDGWRKNAGQTDKIASVFAQYELTHKTSIQAEYRYRDNERGDVSLNFFESNDLPNLNVEDNTDTYRLGLRHSFSPGSDLIGNFMYQKGDNRFFDVIPLDPALTGFPSPPIEDSTDAKANQDAYSSELQHLFRSSYITTVAGGGYFKIKQDVDLADDLSWPGESPPLSLGSFRSKAKFDIDHYNVYLYSYLNLLKNITLTVGASGDFYDSNDKIDDQDLNENKFNPKFGITWNPHPSTTVRGAVFRTFKRTLITNQTLEPTQVAGFNQFFDDIDGTKAWVYGVGIDQKLPKNIYAGAEFSYRDLNVPIFEFPEPGVMSVNRYKWDEYVSRAYLNWTPHDWVALSAEYRYEDFKYQEGYNPGATRVETHSVPLGVNLFHPSGLSCGLKVTYWDQNGKFKDFDAFTYKSGDDTFWLADAAIGYRFPKRYGFFTIGVSNLFDKHFEYFEVDYSNSRIQPERFLFATITLALP
jgi:Tfp pilus assembly protein PilF/opacity protein-like surface antigen